MEDVAAVSAAPVRRQQEVSVWLGPVGARKTYAYVRSSCVPLCTPLCTGGGLAVTMYFPIHKHAPPPLVFGFSACSLSVLPHPPPVSLWSLCPADASLF